MRITNDAISRRDADYDWEKKVKEEYQLAGIHKQVLPTLRIALRAEAGA